MTRVEWACLVTSAAADLAIALLVLLRGSGPVGTGRVLAAGLAVGVALAAKIVAAPFFASASFFFAVSLAYADVMVVVPLVGIVVLVASRRRPVTPLARACAALGLALAPVGGYASFVEPFRLTVERVTIPLDTDRPDAEELRIAVLADIQAIEVHEHHRAAVREAMAFEPHLILLPGDLIQAPDIESHEAAMPAFRELLAPLDAPLGVWFVIGNTDWGSRVRDVFEGTRVKVLENEWIVREHAGRRVVVGGSGMYWRDAEVERFVGELEALTAAETGGHDLRILLAHFPDVIHHLSAASRIDLVVAGHTHGGQVSLPLIGPPITLSTVPRAVAAGGLHEVEGNRVYVSRGLGWEGGPAPRVRFLAPPEVSLLTLVPVVEEGL